MWSNIISKLSGDQCDEHWTTYQQKAERQMRLLNNRLHIEQETLKRWNQ
jgi:hypothetical protein